MEYGVDLWLGGHVHAYHRSWPVANGQALQVCSCRATSCPECTHHPLPRVHALAGGGGNVGGALSHAGAQRNYVDPAAPIHILDGVGARTNGVLSAARMFLSTLLLTLCGQSQGNLERQN